MEKKGALLNPSEPFSTGLQQNFENEPCSKSSSDECVSSEGRSNPKIHFEFLTLFPEAIEPFLRFSLLGKAHESGLIASHVTDLRNFSTDRTRRVDDTPYGGGGGMVLKVDVLVRAWQHLRLKLPEARTILLSPQGKRLTQDRVCELAAHSSLIFVCGHYEGVDERFIEMCVDDQISIGDYVLSGGELPALVLTDAVSRWVPGFVGNGRSVETDSFSPLRSTQEVLKAPQYTKPIEFMGRKVPEVLTSGHHQHISKWRTEISRVRSRNLKGVPDPGGLS